MVSALSKFPDLSGHYQEQLKLSKRYDAFYGMDSFYGYWRYFCKVVEPNISRFSQSIDV